MARTLTTLLWRIQRVRMIAFPKDVVLLFGSERFGVPRTLLDRADATIGIPIYGVNHSLPLAIAAGIILHEWARRRYAPGSTA